MSNKFTGITSAGSAIPVYDKDAHEALSSKLDITAFSSVSGEFATVDDVVAAVSGKADTSAIPSLDGYATEQWVGEQGYLTEVPEGYATTEDVISATSGLQPSGDYASATDLVNYQPVSAMTAFQPVGDYQPAGSYLSASESANFYPMTGNPSGFLTEHQSLDGYLQNTDLTIVDNKITEISGVPLSAGDELPSGVMNTSALGYNAVNEISGYNGSAIAQYGAEKQWLVHDDTLVHAANSAQYALGVNLSAVAQLLGVDETVLFYDASGKVLNEGNSLTMSGNPLDFERVAITYVHQAGWTNVKDEIFYKFGLQPYFCLKDLWYRDQTGYKNFWETVSYNTFNSADNTITTNVVVQRPVLNSAWASSGLSVKIYEIRGIGRKQ